MSPSSVSQTNFKHVGLVCLNELARGGQIVYDFSELAHKDVRSGGAHPA